MPDNSVLCALPMSIEAAACAVAVVRAIFDPPLGGCMLSAPGSPQTQAFMSLSGSPATGRPERGFFVDGWLG